MKRPSLTSSSVSAIFAIRAGFRKRAHATNEAIWTRRVVAARAASTVQQSQAPDRRLTLDDAGHILHQQMVVHEHGVDGFHAVSDLGRGANVCPAERGLSQQ